MTVAPRPHVQPIAGPAPAERAARTPCGSQAAVRILIRKPGEPWRAPEVLTFDNEAALQQLLQESPGLLPGVGEQGVVAVRELFVPGSGPVDIVCVDHAGTITVCECKLRTNPDMRRTIVGQALAYASGIWKMDYAEFNHRFETRGGAPLVELVEASVATTDLDWDQDTFQASVAQNLRDGNFRLVFAVDSITDELKRIVEYLNEHTATGVTILAVELGFVSDSGVEILTPAVYGQEAAAAKDTRRKRASGGGSAATSVGLIVEHAAIPPGTRLTLHPALLRPPWRSIVQEWAAADAQRLAATWRPDEPSKPIEWDFDGGRYSPNGVTKAVVEAAGGEWTAFQAPSAWFAPGGESLKQIGDRLRENALQNVEDDTQEDEPSNQAGSPTRDEF